KGNRAGSDTGSAGGAAFAAAFASSNAFVRSAIALVFASSSLAAPGRPSNRSDSASARTAASVTPSIPGTVVPPTAWTRAPSLKPAGAGREAARQRPEFSTAAGRHDLVRSLLPACAQQRLAVALPRGWRPGLARCPGG